MDYSLPCSSVHGIFQVRVLEWVAISFFNAWKWKNEREVAQSCPTLSDPMDYSLPGSSVHGILQARVLEWDAIYLKFGVHVDCLSNSHSQPSLFFLAKATSQYKSWRCLLLTFSGSFVASEWACDPVLLSGTRGEVWAGLLGKTFLSDKGRYSFLCSGGHFWVGT